MIEINVEILIL